MTSTKKYTGIFVALMVLSTAQFALEVLNTGEVFGTEVDLPFTLAYWPAFGVILFVSSLKALAVAGWFMHLREEPRSVTYIAIAGLVGVLALTAGASFSIIGT
jgi:cytochrome c oxidase subunit 4